MRNSKNSGSIVGIGYLLLVVSFFLPAIEGSSGSRCAYFAIVSTVVRDWNRGMSGVDVYVAILGFSNLWFFIAIPLLSHNRVAMTCWAIGISVGFAITAFGSLVFFGVEGWRIGYHMWWVAQCLIAVGIIRMRSNRAVDQQNKSLNRAEIS